MRGGFIVDATFLDAPSSTKNATGTKDPKAHSGRKSTNYHFGYKAHIGADAGSGLAHTVSVTSANTSDVVIAHTLVRDDDTFCYSDSEYSGIEKRDEVTSDKHLFKMNWKISEKPSRIKGAKGLALEHRKASTRCKIEHIFLVVKRQFGFSKTRYCGLAKTSNALTMLFTLANVALWVRGGGCELPCTG